MHRGGGLLLLLLASLSLSGCGTIFGLGADQDVFVVTRPPGATLELNHVPLVGLLTPCTVSADTAENQRLVVTYTDANGRVLTGRTTFAREVRSWVVLLDGVFTLGLGLLVDWATGAMYRFDREQVVVNLGKVEFAPPQPEPIRIAQPLIPRPRDAALDPAPDPAARPEPEPERAPGACDVCGERRGKARFCPHCGYQ